MSRLCQSWGLVASMLYMVVEAEGGHAAGRHTQTQAQPA